MQTQHDIAAQLPSPLPSPLPTGSKARGALATAQAQLAAGYLNGGEHSRAAEVLTGALRAGLWRYPRLWSALWLASTFDGGYPLVRDLWWESPRSAHESVPPARVVAGAAAAAGEHDDARGLLRQAILQRAAQRRVPRARLGRLKRAVLGRLPVADHAAAGRADRAAAALAAATPLLAAAGARSFLAGGTLLQYGRGAGPLPDEPLVIGAFAAEATSASLVGVLAATEGFSAGEHAGRLCAVHANGTVLDPHPYDRDGAGRLWHETGGVRWPHAAFELAEGTFLGQSCQVPEDVPTYLGEVYGKWQRVGRRFDPLLDAPHREVVDADLFHTMLLFRLLDLLQQGGEGDRRRYVRQLRELGEGEWLERV